MVIRFPCFLETCKFVGTQRQIMVICLPCLPETIESDGMRRPLRSSASLFAIQRQSSSMACGDHHGHLHPFSYPKTIKSDGMRRLSWSSEPFFPSRDNQVWWHAETIKVLHFRCFLRLFKLSFSIQRQSSLMACRDHDDHSFSLFFETIKVSFAIQRQSCPLARRDKSWSSTSCRRLQCLSTETIKVSFAIQRHASPLAHKDKLWSSSPLLSGDNQVRWHTKTNYGHPHPFCYPETRESDGMRRQIMVIRTPLLSRDNQVRWHVETNYGHPHTFAI